jgi:hypothetical protein
MSSNSETDREQAFRAAKMRTSNLIIDVLQACCWGPLGISLFVAEGGYQVGRPVSIVLELAFVTGFVGSIYWLLHHHSAGHPRSPYVVILLILLACLVLFWPGPQHSL